MTTIEAAPTLTPMSVEICGKSESETRTIDWLANDATARSVMAEVALPPEAVDEVAEVRRAFYRAIIDLAAHPRESGIQCRRCRFVSGV